MIEICLASNNLHKIEELQKILGKAFTVRTLSEIGCDEDIEETGSTFAENSLIKAKYVFDKYGINVLADDSGLEVEALNGRPGVYSARYAGEPSDATANNIKLIDELKGIENHTFEGEVFGRIKDTFDGEVGFGYNPVFIPDGYTETFHEMGFEQRSRLNHRGRAMEKVMAFLKTN
jgi:XTP/dITP diphosphohydrolase